ncbi:MAG: hypothetical protein J6U96_05560 [Elusimicrobiaceae bacterium]|nr:hypothetical protein [Elusimicrobiaceae bacterium]
MIYFAHRGASAYAPANSLAAFALARQQGATHYELDVHLSKDGHLIIHHDYNLGTDTTCRLDIKDAVLSDITACRILHKFDPALVVSPPRLRDVIPVIMEELELLNIEIKNDDNVYPGIEKMLWQRVEAFGPEAANKILFSSFDYPTLQRLRRVAPRARIGLLTRFFEPQKVLSLKAESVHINQTRITQEMIDWCHEHGVRVFVYTVNDKYTARQLARKGVDGIFTDAPDLFLPPRAVLPGEMKGQYVPLKLSKKTRTSRKIKNPR